MMDMYHRPHIMYRSNLQPRPSAPGRRRAAKVLGHTSLSVPCTALYRARSTAYYVGHGARVPWIPWTALTSALTRPGVLGGVRRQ